MYPKRRRRQNQQHEVLPLGRGSRDRSTRRLRGATGFSLVGLDQRTDASGITEEHLLATCGLSRSHATYFVQQISKAPSKDISPVEVVVSGEEPAKDVSSSQTMKLPHAANVIAQEPKLLELFLVRIAGRTQVSNLLDHCMAWH